LLSKGSNSLQVITLWEPNFCRFFMHVVVLCQFDYEKLEFLYFLSILAIGLCSNHLGVTKELEYLLLFSIVGN
jgi:hypothetical protein